MAEVLPEVLAAAAEEEEEEEEAEEEEVVVLGAVTNRPLVVSEGDPKNLRMGLHRPPTHEG